MTNIFQWAWKIGRLVLLSLAGFHIKLFTFTLIASLVLLHVNPKNTALMIYRHQKHQPIHFVPLKQIPLTIRKMIVQLEDYHFYNEGGIDIGSIIEAYKLNKALGYKLRGASTITQQLVRNLFLTPRKTYIRKYIEACMAIEMSWIVPKSRVLELYLNCIEWGKGIYGIGAATTYYYNMSVADLSLDQQRRLSSIITNPRRFGVDTLEHSGQMKERYDFLMERYPDEDN
jgi:monofunctional biosynthetic peptidoglycan transglycosylase